MKWLALALLATGCADTYYRELVVKTAANEHRCPAPAAIKTIVSEDRMHSDFAYWVNVCGAERLYRMDATTGSRFVDQTQAVR